MNELSLFNRFFNDMDEDYVLPSLSIRKACTAPKVDVLENSDAYTLEMDLPGKSEKDVNIELNENVLTISSQEESSAEESEEKTTDTQKPRWLLRERSFSSFSRSFTLPKDVDLENLAAQVKNGVLTVKMPRKALSQPKKIQITVA